MLNQDPLAEIKLGFLCCVEPLAADGLESSIVIEVLCL
jgi:hypothetical protein